MNIITKDYGVQKVKVIKRFEHMGITCGIHRRFNNDGEISLDFVCSDYYSGLAILAGCGTVKEAEEKAKACLDRHGIKEYREATMNMININEKETFIRDILKWAENEREMCPEALINYIRRHK